MTTQHPRTDTVAGLAPAGALPLQAAPNSGSDPFSICFSSAETPLQVLELNPRDRYQVDTNTIMDLAEYFPGGGTDFQRPLTRRLTV